MWLEVTATDEGGKQLLNERRDFGTVMKDEAGDFPAEMWDAAAIHTDDRIPPRESTSNEYSFPMAQGAVTVKAALYYRSCPEELAAKAKVDVPTTTMAEVTKVVYPSAEAMEAATAEEDQSAETPGESGPGLDPIVVLAIAAGVIAVAAVAFAVIKRRSAK